MTSLLMARSYARRCRTAVPIAMLLSFAFVSACGPSRPSHKDYVGHWTEVEHGCNLHVTLVGSSLVAKGEDRSSCSAGEEVYSLMEDGTAKGGPMGAFTLLFDRKTDQIIVTGMPRATRLRRDGEYHATRDAFAGTWKTSTSDKDAGLLYPPLIIEAQADGGFRIREQEVLDNREFQNVVYDAGVIRGILYMAVDSEHRWPFDISRSADGGLVYTDFRGRHNLEKQ